MYEFNELKNIRVSKELVPPKKMYTGGTAPSLSGVSNESAPGGWNHGLETNQGFAEKPSMQTTGQEQAPSGANNGMSKMGSWGALFSSADNSVATGYQTALQGEKEGKGTGRNIYDTFKTGFGTTPGGGMLAGGMAMAEYSYDRPAERRKERQYKEQNAFNERKFDFDKKLDFSSSKEYNNSMYGQSYGMGGPVNKYPGGGNIVNSYDTYLSPKEEEGFNKWVKTIPERLRSNYDYDIKGFYKQNPNWSSDDSKVHMGDEFKKPNHPTFSNESGYYNEQNKQQGGKWFGDQYLPNTYKMANGGEMAQRNPLQVIDFKGAPKHEQGGLRLNSSAEIEDEVLFKNYVFSNRLPFK